jgi:gliding motility-associated-like protein
VNTRSSLLILLSTVLFCAKMQAQIVTTIAGTGVYGSGGNGNPATSTNFGELLFPVSDQQGNIFFCDFNNNVLWKMDTAGILSILAGSATGQPGYSGDGGLATAALLQHPSFLSMDQSGNFYFVDQNDSSIRMINTAGVITTLCANTAQAAPSGDGGPLNAAGFMSVFGIVPDNKGNLYISDAWASQIRKVDHTGIVSTVVGTGAGYQGDGGPATAAQLKYPYPVLFDNAGNMYIPDTQNDVVRKVDPSGIITTIAGNRVQGYSGDGGPAAKASLSYPWALCMDPDNNLYIGDAANYVVRKIDRNGIITTFAGNGGHGYTGDGGPAVDAQLGRMLGISYNIRGFLCLSDEDHFLLRKVTLPVCPQPLSQDASVNIEAATTTICQGTPVIFTAKGFNGGANPEYEWLINHTAVGSDSSSFSSTGLQQGDTVACKMISSLTCTAPALSQTIAMTVNPQPELTVGPDTVLAPGQSIQLYSSVTGVSGTYQWTPATTLSNPTIPNPIARPDTTTTYQLTVRTDAGCSAAGKVTIGVYRSLHMPNAFTPNGDGKNDLFRIPPSTTIQLKRFSVYNRWGALVFSTNSSSEGWDGRVNGRFVAPGTYIWDIAYVDPLTGRPREASGTVALIR